MSATYWREKEAEEQASATLMLLAEMQQTVTDLRARVQALEEQMASLSEPAEYDDEEAAQTYMDGTPVL